MDDIIDWHRTICILDRIHDTQRNTLYLTEYMMILNGIHYNLTTANWMMVHSNFYYGDN